MLCAFQNLEVCCPHAIILPATEIQLGASQHTCMGVAPGSLGVAGDTRGGVMIAGVLPRALCAIWTEDASTSACKRTAGILNCTSSCRVLSIW